MDKNGGIEFDFSRYEDEINIKCGVLMRITKSVADFAGIDQTWLDCGYGYSLRESYDYSLRESLKDYTNREDKKWLV